MSVIAQSEMTAERSELRFVMLLLVAGMVGAAFFVLDLSRVYAGSDGYLAVPRQPFGADFVNLWTVGKMVLSGLSGDVYWHEDFMAYQQTFMQADIGLRMWAYPPHSLLLVWPFGLAGYYGIFVIWSLLGLAVLAAGARNSASTGPRRRFWRCRRPHSNASPLARPAISPAACCLQHSPDARSRHGGPSRPLRS